MWHAGTSRSREKNETAFESSLPGVSQGSSLQRGFTYWNPQSSIRRGATVIFARDQAGTLGVRATLLATRLEIPSTAPPNRLIVKEAEPRQWEITCRGRSPMCWRTSSIAGG